MTLTWDNIKYFKSFWGGFAIILDDSNWPPRSKTPEQVLPRSMQMNLYVPIKGSILLQLFPESFLHGLSMDLLCSKPLPQHSCRLTFQFQGISVQFPAIYHVKRISKRKNGSTFTLAKTFPFRKGKSCWMNNIRKVILVLENRKIT